MEDRESIRELGGDLAVFYNAHPKLVAAWRRDATDLPDDLIVAADPDATLYEALGTKRTNPVALVGRSIGGALKSAREGRYPRATSADMLRLGADVAVRADGEIAKLHLAKSPDDRVPLRDMAGALS